MSGLAAYLNSLESDFVGTTEESSYEFSLEVATKALHLLELVPEKELLALFNALIAQFINCESNAEIAAHIGTAMVQDTQASFAVKLAILTNYYNKLSENDAARFTLYKAIFQVAIQSNEVDTIRPTFPSLEKCTDEWGISDEEKARFFVHVSDSLKDKDPVVAFHLLVKALALHGSVSNKANAEKAIKLAVGTKSILQFGPLLSLAAMKPLGSTPSVELVRIFHNSSLADFKSHVKKHPSLLADLHVSETDAIRKIRILTLASLASKHLGQIINYQTVAAALDIPLDQVEFWVIDGIRAKLIDARLDQLHSTITITRATNRRFEAAQWTELASKIDAWKSNVTDCLAVIQAQ
ncbi:hypothetical protein HDV03_001110 [Kappamyces sp. JEL0829]|nr:hypothetical protein HDV03_001110 [Kappamyces sp. JEL0829]